MSARRPLDWRPIFFLIAFGVTALDRITKIEIQRHFAEGVAHTVIPGFFRITHVVNYGAAFSLFENAPAKATRFALTGFSLITAIVIIVFVLRGGRRFSAIALGFSLVLGGALGNAWDRLQYGVVTDFLEFRLYHYHWPDFNVADSAIVIGGILIFFDALFTPQQPKRV